MDTSRLLTKLNDLFNLGIRHLKAEQEQLLTSVKDLKDTIGVLPTGFGKSFIIDAGPFVLDLDQPAPVLVISPLDAIQQEQKAKYGELGMIIDGPLIASLPEPGEPSNESAEALNRAVYLIGHPEHMCSEEFGRKFLRENEQIKFCMVDEAHCLLTWADEAFRPSFGKIGMLRSLLPRMKFVALTATATPSSVTQIAEELRMDNYNVISASPDRTNFFYRVFQREKSSGGERDPYDSIDAVLDPLINELMASRTEFPKTVVFLSQLQWAGYCMRRCLHLFPSSVEDELVGQYHAAQTKLAKIHIAELFRDGRMRMVFATEAYSMGVDVPDIRRAVFIGVPSSLEVFVQESGRCGRDGLPATIELHFNNTDVRKNAIIEDSIRKYCVNVDSCRRLLILKHFGFENQSSQIQNDCCDICTPSASPVSAPDTPSANFKDRLRLEFDKVNAAVGGAIPGVRTGLSSALADALAAIPVDRWNADELREALPDITDDTLNNVISCITAMRI